MVNVGEHIKPYMDGSYEFGRLLDLHGFSIWSTFPTKKNTVDEYALSIGP